VRSAKNRDGTLAVAAIWSVQPGTFLLAQVYNEALFTALAGRLPISADEPPLGTQRPG
jgi:hypothetical protein